MKTKVLLLGVMALMLLMAACVGAPAAPAATADPKVAADLAAAQSLVANLQSQLDQAKKDAKEALATSQAAAADKTKLQGQLVAADAQFKKLQDQVNQLKQDSQLKGATPEETAKKIIKLYNDTHVYTIIDLFTCGDMSLEVWNMLKAQNINARVQIGKVQNGAAKEMTDSDHAWVMAEITPARYLALETTNGLTVTEKENPLYYQGWFFKSPQDYRDYINLLNEYNLRLSITNEMITRHNQLGKDLEQAGTVLNQMIATFNSQYAGKPLTPEVQAAQEKINAQKLVVQEKQGRVNHSMDEINRQKAPLPGIKEKMKGLVSG